MPLLKKKLPKKTQLSVVNLIKHSQKNIWEGRDSFDKENG